MTRADLRATNARRTRAAIRAAALTLVRESGYAAMTVDDVAALAGVSRRTVFNHFASKADILVIGMEPPERGAVEVFVNGTGGLLEDLGALLASEAEAVESERGWLAALPEIVRNNPEIEAAIQERLKAIAFSLADAAARRLRTTTADPRTRAVVAMAMAIQRTAMDMWVGADSFQRGEREASTQPDARGGPQSADPSRGASTLAEAVRTMTEAVGRVVGQCPPCPPGPPPGPLPDGAPSSPPG